MKFNTQYDAHERIQTCAGSPVKQLFTGRYNERGQIELTEDGTENIYEYIQSFAESTDIHSILRRYQNGEVDVLSKVQGVYADITEMPQTYAEALQRIADSEKIFMELPVETRAKFGHSFTEFLAASQDDDFLDKLGIKVEPVKPVVTEPVEPTPAIPVVKEVTE